LSPRFRSWRAISELNTANNSRFNSIGRLASGRGKNTPANLPRRVTRIGKKITESDEHGCTRSARGDNEFHSIEGERLRTAFELASSQSTLLRSGESSHVMGLQLDLKTLFNPKDKEQITSWLQAVRPTSSCLWGKVVPAPDGSLSDGFRMCMDQKPVNPARLSYPGSEVGCPLGPNPLAEGVQNGAGAGPEGRRDSARGVSQRRARAKESRRSLHAATRNLPMASPIADYRAWRVPVWIVVFLCEVGRCIPAIVSWLAPESGLLRTGQASSKAQKQQGSSALRLLPSWLEPVGFFF